MTEIGHLYIISAPSGTGKTTLVKHLVDSIPQITVSISHTTRKQRPGELNGVNYYFVDHAEFQRLIDHQDFLEHATIFGNLYGTSKRWVEETLKSGKDVILEIDWQGHQQIKRLFPDAIGIFILPPSLNCLKKRLISRQQDHPEIIEQRLADVRETISHLSEYGYVIVNDDFPKAVHDLKTIIEAGRLEVSRQTKKYGTLLHDLSVKL